MPSPSEDQGLDYEIAPDEIRKVVEKIIEKCYTPDGHCQFEAPPVPVLRTDPSKPWKEPSGRLRYAVLEPIAPRVRPLLREEFFVQGKEGLEPPVQQLTLNGDELHKLAAKTRDAVIDAALAFAIIGRPDVVCHSEVARRRGDDLPAVRDLKGILAQGILPLQSRKGGGEDEDESGDEE